MTETSKSNYSFTLRDIAIVLGIIVTLASANAWWINWRIDAKWVNVDNAKILDLAEELSKLSEERIELLESYINGEDIFSINYQSRFWKDFSPPVGGRELRETYINDTGYPLTVSVTLTGPRTGDHNQNSCDAQVFAGSEMVAYSHSKNRDANKYCFATAVIPNGVTHKVISESYGTGRGRIIEWNELRFD